MAHEKASPSAHESFKPYVPDSHRDPGVHAARGAPGHALRDHLRGGDRLRRACAPASPCPPRSRSRCSRSACCAPWARPRSSRTTSSRPRAPPGSRWRRASSSPCPRSIFLGFPLEYSRIFLLAMIGGWPGRALHDPAAPAAHREGARQPPLPRGHGLRGRARRGREGRLLREPRLLRARPRRRLHALPEQQRRGRGQRETPTYNPAWLPGASLRAAITSEYLGRRLHHRAPRSRA